MKRVRPYGTLIALAVALAAITAITVALVNHGSEQAVSTALTPARGAVLATSLVVLLIAGRALLRQVRHESEHADRLIERRACPECEREVHGAWRMCPYCGALVEESRAPKKREVPV